MASDLRGTSMMYMLFLVQLITLAKHGKKRAKITLRIGPPEARVPLPADGLDDVRARAPGPGAGDI